MVELSYSVELSARSGCNTPGTPAGASRVGPPPLRQLGQHVMLQQAGGRTHDDFLRGWTQHKTEAPFATNYNLKVPPAMREVRFASHVHTGTRVFNRPMPDGLHSAASTSQLQAYSQAGPFADIAKMRTAGVKSGRTDLDLGRLGILNGR
eukprot:TRINITY_DN12905_c0_g1_i1.p1 TRINITY_DN12905_c0_g1~~TRINITY_DN12905_c0_g1_i1.p1  ORF type:complete len:150 (+),score=32.02 TRINITY_DN12905_c0_g1_i1:120-569(+)